MKHEKVLFLLLSAIVLGVWVIIFQNAGILPPISKPKIDIGNTVDVSGSVDINNTVDVNGSVNIDGTVDVNLAELVGYSLVSSKQGMSIGISSTSNTVIPINWGEFSIAR